ncbi:hypothetical protein NQ318_022553 [Aromia moschata]|uniref:DDE Tnp4 domain-containing protein n=1 Tax=Aromia moschata TaxID=1265417 RepID=A0AAV8XN80_9CUCU|nr:hypothetical protein NQ318_022553 [Aromia moschata]
MVESIFGILATRFGVFQRAFQFNPIKTRKIVLSCYLHNFLRKSGSYFSSTFIAHEDIESGISASQEVFELIPLESLNQRNSLNIAKQVRDAYCEYFNNEGFAQLSI